MKKMLGGHKLMSDTEVQIVQSVIRQWFEQQITSLFASGIQ